MLFAILLLGIETGQVQEYARAIIPLLQKYGVNHPMTTFIPMPGIVGHVFDERGHLSERIAMIGIPAFSELLDNGELGRLLKEVNQATGIATASMYAPVYANFGGETV